MQDVDALAQRLPGEQVLEVAEVRDVEPRLRAPAGPEPEGVRAEVDDEPARVLAVEPVEEARQAPGARARPITSPTVAVRQTPQLLKLQRHSSGTAKVSPAARRRNGTRPPGSDPTPCAPAIERSTSAIPCPSRMRKKMVAIVTRKKVSATATGPGIPNPSFDSRRWPTSSIPCHRPQARKVNDAPCHRPLEPGCASSGSIRRPSWSAISTFFARPSEKRTSPEKRSSGSSR